MQLVCQTDVSCQATHVGVDSIGLVCDAAKGRTMSVDFDMNVMAIHLERNLALWDEYTSGDEFDSMDTSDLWPKYEPIDQTKQSPDRLVLVINHAPHIVRLEVPILIDVKGQAITR